MPNTENTLTVANEGESLLHASISRDAMDTIRGRFDCFTRSDVKNEIILDCIGLEDSLEELQTITGFDTSDWVDRYILLYVE